MKRILSTLLLLTLALPIFSQVLAVDKTDHLKNDRLIICGKGKPLDMQAVNGYLNQGLQIVSLGYTPDGWIIAMAYGTGLKDQEFITSKDFPREWYETRENRGLRITAMGYGNNMWCIVMSKGTPFGVQHMVAPRDWTKTESTILENMKQGKFITSCAFGEGKWNIAMSPCSVYKHQVFFKYRNTQDLEQEIGNYWRKGYTITSLSMGNNEYLCVMAQYKEGNPASEGYRALIRSRNWRNELKDFWSQGYHVINVCNGVPTAP